MESKEEFIQTNCHACKASVIVSTSQKCATCPECGFHWEWDVAQTNERFKRLMRTVFGEKPSKPENN